VNVRLSTWESEKSEWTCTVDALEYHQKNYEAILNDSQNPVHFYRKQREVATATRPRKSARYAHVPNGKITIDDCAVDFEVDVDDDRQRCAELSASLH
jgi:hypothetical protein